MRGKRTCTESEVSVAKNLAEGIKELRKSKGLMQEKLVLQADETVPTYQRLEKGFSSNGEPLNPKMFTLLKVCKALGVTLSELLDGLDKTPQMEINNAE